MVETIYGIAIFLVNIQCTYTVLLHLTILFFTHFFCCYLYKNNCSYLPPSFVCIIFSKYIKSYDVRNIPPGAVVPQPDSKIRNKPITNYVSYFFEFHRERFLKTKKAKIRNFYLRLRYLISRRQGGCFLSRDFYCSEIITKIPFSTTNSVHTRCSYDYDFRSRILHFALISLLIIFNSWVESAVTKSWLYPMLVLYFSPCYTILLYGTQ